MTTKRGMLLTSALATIALLGAPVASAQQGEQLSEEEVTSFFDDAERELTQMVEAGEFEQLMGWIEERLADEARFAAGMDTYMGDERKGFSTFALDKEDVTRMGRMAIGILAGLQDPDQAIEDYTLEIEVNEVVPAGPDAATVNAHFTETVTLALPARAAPAEGEDPDVTGATDPAEAGESITVEATADCQHLVRRNDAGDGLMIGLTTCQAEMRF